MTNSEQRHRGGFLVASQEIPGLPGRTVGSFWQWAYSDILSNRNRSILAEFMVGVALGVVDQPRVEWEWRWAWWLISGAGRPVEIVGTGLQSAGEHE